MQVRNIGSQANLYVRQATQSQFSANKRPSVQLDPSVHTQLVSRFFPEGTNLKITTHRFDWDDANPDIPRIDFTAFKAGHGHQPQIVINIEVYPVRTSEACRQFVFYDNGLLMYRQSDAGVKGELNIEELGQWLTDLANGPTTD